MISTNGRAFGNTLCFYRYTSIQKSASKLGFFDFFEVYRDLAKAGHIRLLTTSITKREVLSQIDELLTEAKAALAKHSSIVRQVAGSDVYEKIEGIDAADKLTAAFERFLQDTKAIEVPLTSDTEKIFEDYFARRPPFSEKKKAEFPDAVVVVSLREWCEKRAAKVYVISDDTDMKACCSEEGPLIHLETVSEIISKAAVSDQIHDALESALTENAAFIENLKEKVGGLDVAIPSRVVYMPDNREAHMWGRLIDATDVTVVSVSVLEHSSDQFQCEVEFEVGLSIQIEVNIEGRCDEPFDYEPDENFTKNKTIYQTHFAEALVHFDPAAPDDLEIESSFLAESVIEIELSDIATCTISCEEGVRFRNHDPRHWPRYREARHFRRNASRLA